MLMKGTTHLLAGILLGLVLPSQYRFLTLALATLGSLLPDIDTMSKISNSAMRIPFIKHRGLTHALWIPLLLLLVALKYYSSDINIIILPLLLGILSHIVLDCMTPSGIRLLYPFELFHIRGNFKSGGLKEFFFQLILCILIMAIVLLKL